MTPFFQTWSDFFNMGGHGFYVWLCYGITVAALLILIISGFAEKKQILTWVAKEQQRQARQQRLAQEANNRKGEQA
ncbi:heme exporter protein CcmD [Testudinibacter sp. P80/BLE/0925]|uniref:heme exporter protein CcmD n=1 Tax=Testudinibacter sp. TW-1 TaxID=3417757 RepID=UPI003D36CF99